MKKRSIVRCATLLVLGNVVFFVVFIALIEGVVSVGLFLRDMWDVPKPANLARQHYARYDSELGWVNKPNLNAADVYGPGVYVKTNAQGFRSEHEIAAVVPAGKTRFFCSGDSYTFGYGVDNAHTWCELLAKFDPRLEAVNIGGDGYGVDQAFLRYKKQAAALQHQVHFFAFITDDFYRMLNDSFLGYGKPLLELENGKLVVKNSPVPVKDSYAPRLARIFEQAKNLRTFEVIRRFRRKFENPEASVSVAAPAVSLSQSEKDRKARRLLAQVFAELKELSRLRSIQLVLVYLPTIWELEKRPLPGWSPHQEWLEFLKAESQRQQIPLINVFEKFETLAHGEMVKMFIPEEKLPYPEARFHMNESGNEVTAKFILESVAANPALTCLLLAHTQVPAAGSGTPSLSCGS